MNALLILFICLIVLVIIGIPICYSLGLSGLIYLLIKQPDLTTLIPQRIWAGTSSYVMIALPLFILAGELMNKSGITKRIIKFCLYLVRPIRGGLGEVNVVASMIFGGISGSSVADTSAIGSVLIPEMEKNKYSIGFSTGITVASSTMGMIIPPSIPMLTYAMISDVSVDKLFLAGLIPGILIGLSQIIMVRIMAKKEKYEVNTEKIKAKEVIHTTLDGLLAIIMPVVIVVTVSCGVATASESAAVAVLYALILGFLVYRELRVKHLPKILLKTIISSSSVMIIIGYSMIFGWIMAMEQVPAAVQEFFMNLDIHRVWILLLLDLFILFIGMFLDVTPALFLLTPILIPVMGHYGVDPLQLGAIMIVGLAIGLVTPPLGMCLNAATKISKLSIMKIFKSALPYLVCNIIVLLLVTFIPAISKWLPSIL